MIVMPFKLDFYMSLTLEKTLASCKTIQVLILLLTSPGMTMLHYKDNIQ